MDLKMIQDLILQELSFYFKGHIEEIAQRPGGYIDELSKNEKSVKIIFDQINFKILNISENVENFTEFSAETLRNKRIISYLNFIALDHILFLYVWQNWINKIVTKYGNNDVLQDSFATFCGIKLRLKKGHLMRVMIRQTGLEYLENGTMKVSVISVDNITHLIKSDFYWGRLAFGGKEKRYIHHLNSTDKKDIPHDIISNREKEVLRRIAHGMESKEIGKELFMSPHTVDNHRRNMLARTGARDTTALVQLCLMAGVI